jgi:hypothetical protein
MRRPSCPTLAGSFCQYDDLGALRRLTSPGFSVFGSSALTDEVLTHKIIFNRYINILENWLE